MSLFLSRSTFKTAFLAVCSLCVISACDSTAPKEQNSETYDLIAEIKKSAKDISSNIGKRSGELKISATEELKELLAIEYKIVDLPTDESLEVMQATLSLLGKERWNCFHVIREADKARLLCKRLPPSYFSVLPLLF
jgi:hypothetical protein